MAASSGGNGAFSPTRSILLSFCSAFCFGLCLMYVVVLRVDFGRNLGELDSLGKRIFALQDPHGHIDIVDDSNRVSQHELQAFKGHTHSRQFGQDVLADTLYKQVRILCWILTSPQNLQKKTIHVQATWSRRCNKVIFISSQDDPAFPTVKVEAPEGRQFLWRKTRGAFKYVYDHHLNDADWFLKADDDTYVVLENLRYLLADKNPNDPVFYGRKFKPYVKQGYMSGGAGYVLSKAALKLAVEKAFPNPDLCRSDARAAGAAEDVEMGKCLSRVGVAAGDSRDSQGRERFHPFVPEHHLIKGIVPAKFWYWNYVFYPAQAGPECCSDYSISFHYISPNNMYLLEYMIYHMRPFGVGHYTCPANMDAVLTNIQAPAKVPALGQKDQLGKVAGNAQVKAGDTSKSQEVPADQLMQ